jgi:hypothetical protein
MSIDARNVLAIEQLAVEAASQIATLDLEGNNFAERQVKISEIIRTVFLLALLKEDSP